ncbi:MAG: DUF4034 domain-containing protein [Nitrospirae bacterium]|nr:DUF4034 domain-containing protein [Nitrospirota bacterium]
MNKNLMIVVLVLLLSPAVSTAEISKGKIQKLLNEKHFKELDTIAEEIRRNRKVLDDGGSELGGFYNDLTKDYDREQETARLINLLEEWKRSYPNSPTPLVALSMVYRSYAWEARGYGWAGNVAKEKWDVFNGRITRAYENVDNEIAERDIRSYFEKIMDLRSIGGPDAKKKAYEVLDKGISIDPDNHSLYIAMAHMLLEKWYGEDRYEMINFINKYSEKRNGIEGEMLYIKTLLVMSSYFEPASYLKDMGVSWAALERKIKSVLKSYSANKFFLNAYWYFAGMALDVEKAEEIGRQLDEKEAWINNPWWDSGHKTSTAIKVLLNSKDAAGSWNKNLLRNPSAEKGSMDWSLYGKGGTIQADVFGRQGNIFYIKDVLDVVSNFNQKIVVPREFIGAYVAVAGYLSTDEAVVGPGSKKPYLSGYFMHDGNRIISNLSADTMMYDCHTNCWQPRWGIFKMPTETESITFHMNHSSAKGTTPDDSRFFYDDLELRVFKTLREAEEFIESYKKKHEQIPI